MCGIAGFFNLNNLKVDSGDVLKKMTDQILHRGPDSEGIWISGDNSVALGHRRLSILDLSSAGNQPMLSPNKQFVLAYNGEIYNFLEIKSELIAEGVEFTSQSDTEVLLNGIIQWGLPTTLDKLCGMFAIALWDSVNERLTLVRDRVGEKPLFYGANDKFFFFGSELVSLKHVPYLQKVINKEALQIFIAKSYVPAPLTIYEGIYKLEPGSLLTIDFQLFRKGDRTFNPIKYFHFKIEENKKTGSFDETVDVLDEKLNTVIRQQMIADVSLGAFLSGGIDSSLVTAIMQTNSIKKIKTFCIGFEEKEYNEAGYAADVAKYIGTEHYEQILSNREVKNLATVIPQKFDEPFADSSQIPTYLVAKFAKSNVTVSLSGDGGDELFGGYNKYLRAKELNDKLNKIPGFLKHGLGKFSGGLLESAFIHKRPALRHRLASFRELMKVEGYSELNNFLSSTIVPSFLFKTPVSAPTYSELIKNDSIINSFMEMDFGGYLPDDILVKVDRMAMAVSLESRAPFLDPRILQFASEIPLEFKVNDSNKKRILKGVLKKYIPESYFNRPKKGFSVPLKKWFKDTSNTFIDEVFSAFGPIDEYLNYNVVERLLKEHREGVVDNSFILWNIFVWYQWKSDQ